MYLNVDIPEDIKEQHISEEYLRNKCYPCIDYSMASHLSAFRILIGAWVWMVNRDVNSSKKVANTIHDRITRKDPQPSPGASIVKAVHNHAYDEYLAITGFH